MAYTADGVYYPTQTDAFDVSGDMEAHSKSLPGLIVPVANATERDAYAASRTAEGRGPSTTAPLSVWRADTRDVEINDGTGWYVHPPMTTVTGWESLGSSVSGWAPQPSSMGRASGPTREVYVEFRLAGSTRVPNSAGSFSFENIFNFATAWRPEVETTIAFTYRQGTNSFHGGIARVGVSGDVRLMSGHTGTEITHQESDWSVRMGFSFLRAA